MHFQGVTSQFVVGEWVKQEEVFVCIWAVSDFSLFLLQHVLMGFD